MSRDDLKIFDEIDDEKNEQQEFSRINEPEERETSRFPVKRLLAAALILLLIGLGIMRFMQWRADREEPSTTATLQSSTATEPTATATTTYIDGDSPQAVETRGTPSASAISIASATKPAVDTKNPESVMKGFITIVNSRDSADDFDRVEEWVKPYSLIEDMSSFDVYDSGKNQVLPSPVTVEKIKVEDPVVGQPADTNIRRSRVLKTTVKAHTGQKLVLDWKVTAMKEGNDWKVTEANLDSWSGAK